LRTGKTGAFISMNAAARRESNDVGVHTGLLRGPSHRITENDALIRWLGGLQGRRTAFMGSHQGFSKHTQKEAGYSMKERA